jgi:hypothetical protein
MPAALAVMVRLAQSKAMTSKQAGSLALTLDALFILNSLFSGSRRGWCKR